MLLYRNMMLNIRASPPTSLIWASINVSRIPHRVLIIPLSPTHKHERMRSKKVRDYFTVLGGPPDKYLLIINPSIYTHLPICSQNFQIIKFWDIRALCKVAFSFTPYPLFQWYSPSKEIFKYETSKLSI
jgi:hypothetical protein